LQKGGLRSFWVISLRGYALNHNIERILIKEFNPEWNKTTGKASTPRDQKVLYRKKFLDVEGERAHMSKYHKLEEYLRNIKKQVLTLSYDEIESILGFKLPPSAYKHRAWWANGGHSQANSWLNAGWEVSSIELGKSVTFRKVGKGKTDEYRHTPEEMPYRAKTEPRIEDIPKLIKELYQLKTEGIITEEEFEEKKKHLLSKL